MILFTLEIVNLVILFRVIFGLDFRWMKLPLTLGLLVIAADYVLRIIYDTDMPVNVSRGLFLISAVLPAFFFQGRAAVVGLLGVIVRLYFSLLTSLCWGILIVVVNGDYESLNLSIVSLMPQLMTMCILLILAFKFKASRSKIKHTVQNIRLKFLTIEVLVMCLLYYGISYVGSINENTAYILSAYNMAKDGLIGLSVICTAISIQCLIFKSRELTEINGLYKKCIDEQTRQYMLFSEKNEQLRSFKHDYDEHINAMSHMIDIDDYEGMKNYIIDLNKGRTAFSMISTNNIIADAIFNQYAEIAKEKNIEIIIDGKFPRDVSVSGPDLCIVLSNAIKNAFEATLQCTKCRKIKTEITNNGSFIFISIVNPVVTEPVKAGNYYFTSKEEIETHGIGMKNMKETAEKNGGTVTWIYDNGIIATEITLKE
ncbi:MAG: GHKL domain-containing protein [Muribaculaceae bacterium]